MIYFNFLLFNLLFFLCCDSNYREFAFTAAVAVDGDRESFVVAGIDDLIILAVCVDNVASIIL